MSGWTEYCSELYNHKANGDPAVLNCPQTDTDDDHPILHKEVEAAVPSLKKGESVGVDNMLGELVQVGGEDVITTLMTICNKIWQTGESPTPWTQSLNRLKLQAEKIIAEEQASEQEGEPQRRFST